MLLVRLTFLLITFNKWCSTVQPLSQIARIFSSPSRTPRQVEQRNWSSWQSPAQIAWSAWADGGTGAEVRVNQGIAVNNNQDNTRTRVSGDRTAIRDTVDPKSREILNLLMHKYTDGMFRRKVAQHNTKNWLEKYMRYYWVGNRYYRLRESRITCFYNLPHDIQLQYEDNTPLRQVYFQCKKYFESCCAMDCCKTEVGSNGTVQNISTLIILITILLSLI